MDEQLKNQLGILKTITELEDKNIDKVLNSVQSDLDNAKNKDEASKEVKKQLSRDFDDINWFKDNRKNCIAWIEKLYKAGDRLYTLSICDTLSNSIKIIYEHQTEKKAVEMLKSYYDAIIILCEILYKHDFKVIEANVNPPLIKIKKSNLHKLDGMDILLSNLGDKKFIQLAVAGSYFFDPELVKTTTQDLSNKINNGAENDFPVARYTTNTDIKGQQQIIKGGYAEYIINDSTTSNRELKFKVKIDEDGNRSVRKLISEKTQITVAQGKGSVLQNTIISHVWGRAYDPRYFTSLWNIVLIPAWANSLMDKEDAPEGTLASKMRATYMKICSELYGNVFSEINNENYLKSLPKLKNEKDAIKGGCTFNLIKASKKKIILSKGTGLYSVGDLAKQIIPIIQSDKFDKTKLDSLLDKDKSKELFGLSYPALVKADDNTFDPIRYYKQKIRINSIDYRLCSQWIERKRKKLENWLNEYKSHNNT